MAKDGSSYNIQTSDITAIPQAQKSPTERKRKVPLLQMKPLETSPKVLEKQNSKESLKQSIVRSSHQSKLSKVSSTLRSKASEVSNKEHEQSSRTQSMLPSLAGRQSEVRAPAALKSSGRVQKQISVQPKKTDRNSLNSIAQTQQQQ